MTEELTLAPSTYRALKGLLPYADLSALMAPRSVVELSEQLAAAMWRLRGMRGGVEQLAHWSTLNPAQVQAQRQLSEKVIVAFAACAENLRQLNTAKRSIPVPDWKLSDRVSKPKKQSNHADASLSLATLVEAAEYAAPRINDPETRRFLQNAVLTARRPRKHSKKNGKR